jgi:peptidoglycan/xylan/chitin deacetylase (PgdA/CDA1 family)
MYHAIAWVANRAIDRLAKDPNRICVSPQRFEAQMRYIEWRRLRGVSVSELLRASGTKSARSLVGLTFDDGYENFLQDALPTLERFGFSATVFVVGGMLGGENIWDKLPRMRLLGAEGVREAAERGIEIGSHGMGHLRMSGLQPEQLEREVVESRRVLGKVSGQAVQGFCYPYGNLDQAAVQAVRRADYTYACALRTRAEGSVYDLPRPLVWELDNPLTLTAKLRFHPVFSDIYSDVAHKLTKRPRATPATPRGPFGGGPGA